MRYDRSIALILGAVGLITVIFGLILGGNPATARRERRDQERSARLSQVSNAINNTFAIQGNLPTSTEAYSRVLDETHITNLPVVEMPEYKQLTNETYELCMTFEEPGQMGQGPISRPVSYPEESPDFWSHGAGRTCYTLRIPSWIKIQRAEIKAREPSMP